MEEKAFTDWVDAYRAAWESNDPDDVAKLFTEDAKYYTEPHAVPQRGRPAIVADWLERKDEPGTTKFSYELVATRGNFGLVRGKTLYTNPERIYSNMWEITLDDEGRRCKLFVEWWMQRGK